MSELVASAPSAAMLPPPAYQPWFERLLAFATRPEFDLELQAARGFFFSRTGEVFDEDRTFDARMQAFLDWYVLDRPLAPFGEPPARAFLQAHPELSADERMQYRLLSRSVHGLFLLARVRPTELCVLDLPTGADYRVPLAQPLAGVRKGDLFEARLVPFEGRYHFSSAFLFHPRHIRPRLVREIRRQRREEPDAGVQDLVWTLSRMAGRAEHYRNFPIDTIYDFTRPPPIVAAERMRFDRESVARRLGRMPALPEAPLRSDPHGA